jgi:hypothetical protein
MASESSSASGSRSDSVSPGTAAGDPRQNISDEERRCILLYKMTRKFDREDAKQDIDSVCWPMSQSVIQRVLHYSADPSPAVRHTLTQEDVKAGKWRGQCFQDAAEVKAQLFLDEWGRTSKRKSEDLTKSANLLWGFYMLGLDTCVDAVGPGIVRFFIAQVPHVSDPDCRTRSLVAFVAWRSDGSQVRINSGRASGDRLLYIDKVGPNYFGHLARTHYDPDECSLAPGAPMGVIANKKGLTNLYDTVTDAEAQAALYGLQLNQDTHVDLSDGIVFPWPLWVHHNSEIMEVIGPNTGVLKVSAIACNIPLMSKMEDIKAVAFRIDLLKPPLSLLLFPLPSSVFVMGIDPTSDPSIGCTNHAELQEAVFPEGLCANQRSATFVGVPWTKRSRAP